MNTKFRAAAFVVSCAIAIGPVAALAGAGHSGGHKTTANIGHVGEAKHVDRQIKVEMGEMFFSPDGIDVQKGETIRFIVTNTGDFVHEFNIGTAAMHGAHAGEMMMMFDSGMLDADRINHGMMDAGAMAHSDPNSVLLEPGKTAEIIWTFNGDAALEISCNVPGHRESGMLGPVNMRTQESINKEMLGS